MKYKAVNKTLRFSIISFIFVASIILLQKALVAQTPPTCCAYCSSGKACGNACIPKNSMWNKPKGCACDGERPKPKIFEKDKGNDLEVRKVTSMSDYPEGFGGVAQNSRNEFNLMNSTPNELEILQDFWEIPNIAQSPSPFKCSIPVIPSKVPRSEQVSTLSFVKKLVTRKRKLEMFLYDDDVLDGNIVRVFVNGTSYGDITLTPKPGKKIEVDLGNEPGDSGRGHW